jgi:hypothetical protein
MLSLLMQSARVASPPPSEALWARVEQVLQKRHRISSSFVSALLDVDALKVIVDGRVVGDSADVTVRTLLLQRLVWMIQRAVRGIVGGYLTGGACIVRATPSVSFVSSAHRQLQLLSAHQA